MAATLAASAPALARAQETEATSTAQTPEPTPAPQERKRITLTYRARLVGVDGDLADMVRGASRLFASDKPEFGSSAGLRRAARDDADRMRRALVASGRYAAEVTYEIKREQGPYEATFTVVPGAQFRAVTHRIVYNDDQPAAERPETMTDAGLRIGRASDGASLQANETALVDRLRNAGFPSAAAAGRRAYADFSEGTAEIVYYVETGPRARFGPIFFSGLEKVKEPFLRKYAGWEDGALYQLEPVIDFRTDLSQTGLFGALSVEAGAVGEDGLAPILVDAQERRRRTIGAGVSYDTDVGPGGRIFFEHRNILGAAERINLELDATAVKREARLKLDKPFPKLPGSFLFETGVTEETTDAFDAQSFDVAAGFAQRYLDDRLTVRYGVGFEAANIEENGVSQQTGLVLIPLSASWVDENDPLNPTSGERFSLSITPYTGAETFVAVETRGATRFALGPRDQFVSALRVRYGAIFGPAAADIPATKRFYAGGGGSVRGYGFQLVGPLDDENDPLGGRSVLEAAFEQRARVWKDLQLAAFIDSGLVSTATTPDEDAQLLWAAGGGLRYLTPVGPIRFDVAVPISRRDVDDAFEFYISIGQPF